MPVSKVILTKNVLLCTVVLALCVCILPASAQEAITTPILASTPNFRDLAGISASNGGTGFANTTGNGGVMRTEVFYRSDYLSLNNADWITISTLHIGRDIDLRTPSEIALHPDVVPYGAVYTNINIYGTPSPVPSPFDRPPAEAISFMQTGYREFVTDQVQRNGFRTALLTLANDSTPDLWHCSGGKDRTGWTAMLMQTIAGVPSQVIMQDYLATNSYTAALMSTTKASLLAQHPSWDPATIDALLGVQSSYLQAGLDQVMATYGSMYAYLTEGLGLTRADIYVLRAKMVYYRLLPGQSGLTGNAASGAAFLNALQDSPLSGRYTAFNYYLQSAIDADTLWGVETRAGGQVHADAASFLLRLPQRIDEAIAPYTDGRDFEDGRTRFWATGLGGGFWSDGRSGVAGSTEYSAGTVLGATHRFNSQASADLGIGYNWGSVGGADAGVTMNTALATLGGRYAFSSLDAGPYITARADIGWIDYQSSRALGGGLGTASGGTDGAFYSGLAGLGDIIRLAPVTVTLQAGVRVTDVTLNGFNENGSDLALGINGMNKTFVSLPFDVNFALDRQQFYGWTVAPSASLGYERALTNPRVESTGTLYGYSVSQYSAFDSHDMMKAGLGLTAQRDVFIVKAGIDGLIGDGAGSSGVGGQLSLSYSF